MKKEPSDSKQHSSIIENPPFKKKFQDLLIKEKD